jgi:hypothetical protein
MNRRDLSEATTHQHRSVQVWNAFRYPTAARLPPEVIAAPPQRLAEVSGLGEAAITEFKIVEAAAQRFARGEVKRRTVLASWSAVLE